MCAHKNFAWWRSRPVQGNNLKNKGIVARSLILELCAHENVEGWRRRPIRGNNLENKWIVDRNLIRDLCTHEMLRNLKGKLQEVFFLQTKFMQEKGTNNTGAGEEQSSIMAIKGTVSWDRFRQCWRKLTDVGHNKGRSWFLNFSEAPLIFSWNKTSSFR